MLNCRQSPGADPHYVTVVETVKYCLSTQTGFVFQQMSFPSILMYLLKLALILVMSSGETKNVRSIKSVFPRLWDQSMDFKRTALFESPWEIPPWMNSTKSSFMRFILLSFELVMSWPLCSHDLPHNTTPEVVSCYKMEGHIRWTGICPCRHRVTSWKTCWTVGSLTPPLNDICLVLPSGESPFSIRI